MISCESYRRVRETSSSAALLWQSRQQNRQPEQSRGTPHRPHTHTHHNGRTAGTDPGSPGNGMDWTPLTSLSNMPLLQNVLKQAKELLVKFFWSFFGGDALVCFLLGCVYLFLGWLHRDQSHVCGWIHSLHWSSMTGRMPEDPLQPDPIQTGSHHLGYHCSYHRDHKFAPPTVVPAGGVGQNSIQLFTILLTEAQLQEI